MPSARFIHFTPSLIPSKAQSEAPKQRELNPLTASPCWPKVAQFLPSTRNSGVIFHLSVCSCKNLVHLDEILPASLLIKIWIFPYLSVRPRASHDKRKLRRGGWEQPAELKLLSSNSRAQTPELQPLSSNQHLSSNPWAQTPPELKLLSSSTTWAQTPGLTLHKRTEVAQKTPQGWSHTGKSLGWPRSWGEKETLLPSTS